MAGISTGTSIRCVPPAFIGVVAETKVDSLGRSIENRVALPPQYAGQLQEETGTPVIVESGAGLKIGFTDADYRKVGVRVGSRSELYQGPFIIGVKETQIRDHDLIVPYCNLNASMRYEHFADSPERTIKAIETSKQYNFAFLALETMQDKFGRFPTLAPMSEAAAEIVALIAPSMFLKPMGIGRIVSGLALHNIEGLKAVVLGGGIVGRTAAYRLASMGMNVSLLESNEQRRSELNKFFKGKGVTVKVLESNPSNLEKSFKDSHVMVSGVYNRGSTPPKIVTRKLLNMMAQNAVAFFVDVDQGSSFEDALPETSILTPYAGVYIPKTHVITFSPPNLPSMGGYDTSFALARATFQFYKAIAQQGLFEAAKNDPTILSGINILDGHITCEGLAKSLGMPYRPVMDIIEETYLIRSRR